MNGFIRTIILSATIASIISCTTRPTEDDLSLNDIGSSDVLADDYGVDDLGGEDAAGAESSSEPTADADFAEDEGIAATENVQDEFADFAEDEAAAQAAPKQQAAEDDPFAGEGDQDLALEEELNQANGEPALKGETNQSNGDLALEDEFSQANEGQAEIPMPEVDESLAGNEEPAAPTEDPFAQDSIADAGVPAPEVDVPQPDVLPPSASAQDVAAPSVPPANITALNFRANESGGTIIINADQPLNYTTRSNPDLNQYIIEVENAHLPAHLKRSLNTKDIKGSVGAVDAYQNPGSTTARFVIQLRDGVSEPAVQMEGNNLLIVASGVPGSDGAQVAQTEPSLDAGSEGGVEESAQSTGQILPSQNLTEFLAGNTRFYGKKISIETNNMDVRDALNFITEESGVNMVIAEEVKGPISLKLRQVPWDQALVVIMRTKKLGYTRQGNVLRIAPLQDLRAEEDDATKLAASRKNIEPLTVRMFPISYAKVDELEKKIKDFLGERGKVVGDTRTNALVVTDIEENLNRVAKLITSLDTQPPQVLIEGKIVEATESFSRDAGISWGATGVPIKVGNGARGPVNMTPSFSINQGAGAGGRLSFGITMGTLDIFGNLSAALALSESEGQVKVISSPRIVALSNEKANINQTTEVPVRQITVTNGIAQETFQFKPLTMKLEVTPQVTADGSVIMGISVNRQFAGETQERGEFAVNSREANTRVLVKNGETAVIGGIYQSDAQKGKDGVPWVRDIPLLGSLFESSRTREAKSELLIFLTPRILGQTDSGTAVKSF